MPAPEDKQPPPGQEPNPGPPPAAADHSGGQFDAGASRGLPAADRPLTQASTINYNVHSTAPDLQAPREALPVNPFGGYELLGVIGRGGMGVVYKARHLQLNVVDALKVMSGERLRSPALRQRFLDEMQTQVRLEHPNIVKIRTAGEFHGEPYFAMVYESGGDLAGLIRANRVRGPRAAAELLLPVAEAVAHAHEKNVIHCDLKPHNILLSAEGTPKVTDFGLALLLAGKEDGRPAAGEPVGTPGYMPPEQAEGRLDRIGPRSDVYGLGAVLYALLTGRPPFEGTGVAEVLRQVKETPPRPPRDLNRQVPRRLEAICLRCLEKDPDRRYAGAREVAEALRGYLHPWWRRRTWEAAAAVAVALLGAGLLWAGWRAYRAPRDKAAAAVRAAEDYRRQGDRTNAIDAYTIAKDELTALAAGPLPAPDGPTLRYDLARVQTQLGALREETREYKAAGDALRAARDLLDALRTRDPRRPEYTLWLAEVHHNLGNHHADLNQLPEAKADYEQALELRQELVKAEPDSRVYRRDLARSYGYLGDAQLLLGDCAAALGSYKEAERLRAALAEEDPGDVDALCLHARDFGNAAGYADLMGRAQEAIDNHRRRLQYYQEHGTVLGDRLPGPYQTERADTALAIAELELEPRGAAPDEVPGLLRQAEDEYARLLNGAAEDRAAVPLQARLAQVHVARGEYALRRGNRAGAATELEAAQKLFESLEGTGKAGPDDYYFWAVAHALQGELAKDDGERALALDKLRRAVKEGFANASRLERDGAFAGVEAEKPDAFHKVVADIKRPCPGG
jgi:serine/threonine-protein kinase